VLFHVLAFCRRFSDTCRLQARIFFRLQPARTFSVTCCRHRLCSAMQAVSTWSVRFSLQACVCPITLWLEARVFYHVLVHVEKRAGMLVSSTPLKRSKRRYSVQYSWTQEVGRKFPFRHAIVLFKRKEINLNSGFECKHMCTKYTVV
jgi:hypothetical protein